MTAPGGRFLVTGLSDLRNALVRAEKVEPKQIRSMLHTVTDVFVEKARPRLHSAILHPNRSTGRLEGSLKGRTTVRSASVVLGTPVRIAYGGWWEFGGPRAKSRRPPNREYIKEGRVLYPTLVEERDEIQAATEAVVNALAQIIIDD
jgi:hypothetical protein